MQPKVPTEEKNIVKEMPSIPLDYLQKRKNKDRRLIRSVGSIEERLQKAANKLDECGEMRIANKIDRLLAKIHENKNV